MSLVKSAGKRGLRVLNNMRMFVDFARWRLAKRSDDNVSLTEHAETLQNDGVVVLENFFPADKCEQIKADIEELLEGNHEDAVYITASETDEHDVWNPSNGAVVMDRSGGGHDHDEGMIDVLHLDEAIDGLESIIQDDKIESIISEATREDYQSEILHAYINRSVTDTRPLHSDMQGVPEFKAFIYLTDVQEESYGPYRYARGSHHSIVKRLVNNVLGGLFDHPGVDMRYLFDAEPMLGDKGTLIISDQTGVHRGTPQEQGRERMLLTIRYRRQK